MAYYLVEAAAKEERLPELAKRLEKDEFLSMRPFGVSVTFSLRVKIVHRNFILDITEVHLLLNTNR